MLNICYYNDQIKEELDGACFYVEKAMKYKTESPSRSQTYLKMSDAEIEHATDLLKMFDEDWKASKTDDPIYQSIYDIFHKMYNETVTRIKVMQTMK